jgi:riboflavin transporter FmnP
MKLKGVLFFMNTNQKEITTTKKLVGTAVFSALAYVVSFLEFPIFVATQFLKLDFSAVFLLLCGFAFGVWYGVGAIAVKEFICFLTKSSTGGVGEIANFLIMASFVVIPSVVYMFKKGLPTVILSLIIASVVQVIVALIVNRFINFPLYMGEGARDVFNSVWYFIVFFNLIKSVAISIITILLYKRISHLIKAI